MKEHDATELAYKKGYAKGYEDGRRDAELKWIPVTERLPLYDKNVLAVDRITGEITTAYLNMFDSFVFKDGRCHGASYWMPLPEPPKED